MIFACLCRHIGDGDTIFDIREAEGLAAEEQTRSAQRQHAFQRWYDVCVSELRNVCMDGVGISEGSMRRLFFDVVLCCVYMRPF